MERDLSIGEIEGIRALQKVKRERRLKGPWVPVSPRAVSLPAEVWVRLQENPDEADAYDTDLEALMSEIPSRK